MNAFDLFYALQFKNQLAFDKQVNPISAVNAVAFVVCRKEMLQFEFNVVRPQFMGQALLLV
jgi:hypothetical protein